MDSSHPGREAFEEGELPVPVTPARAMELTAQRKDQSKGRGHGSSVGVDESRATPTQGLNGTSLDEASLRFLLDNVPSAVVWEASDGTVRYSNKRCDELLGSDGPHSNLSGHPLLAVIQRKSGSTEEKQLFERALRHLKSGANSAEIALPSGSIWQCKRLAGTTAERLEGNLYVFEEVTSTKRQATAEEALRTSAQQMRDLMVDMLARLREEGRRLQDGGLPGAPRDGSPRAPSDQASRDPSCQRLLYLTQDFEDLLKLEGGECYLTEAAFSPHELGQETFTILAKRADQRGIALELVTDPLLPERMIGDGERIKRTLLHLVESAIHSTGGNTVELRIASASPGWCRYEVRDRGRGMAGRTLLGFTDGHHLSPSEFGLKLCHDYAGLMGGNMTVERVAGHVTSVCVELPFVAADPIESGRAEKSEAILQVLSQRPGTSSPTRVFLVEDDESNQLLLRSSLENAGFQVTSASRAQDALRQLAQHPTDVLVTDISMPEMDGIELVAALRRLEGEMKRPRTPAVVVTAYATDEHQRQCRKAGVDVFLTKPVFANTLCHAVAKVSDRRPTVLVVDDNDVSRKAICAVVGESPLGFELVEASSGTEAIMACIERQFSLILMDVLMPGIDGTIALQKIRKLAGFAEVPIFACTAETRQNERLLRLGFTGIVPKPIETTNLLATLRRHLRPNSRALAGAPDQPVPPLGPTLPKIGMPVHDERLESGDGVVFEFDHPALPSLSLPELRPKFLSSCREELVTLRTALACGDFATARRVGHTLLGNGRSFGVDEISDLGEAIERAANREEKAPLLQAYSRLNELLLSPLTPAPQKIS